jgi:hypothetical protein
LLGAGPGGGGVVGDLVDGDQVDREPHIRGDLALLVVEQPVGPLVDLVLKPAEGLDGVIDGRADESVGTGPPQAEFDSFAVDHHQAAIRRQGTVGDDELQGDGLAAAGFAADEHVAFGQGDLNAVAEFVGAQVDGLPDRQRRDRDRVSRHRRSPPLQARPARGRMGGG